MTEQTPSNAAGTTTGTTTGTTAAAPAAAPAPRRRLTVQRGGCGCEGKPSPTKQPKPQPTENS
ncbi:hypothetical protein ACIPUC_33290 [Streptomyces sp. LARHCF249]